MWLSCSQHRRSGDNNWEGDQDSYRVRLANRITKNMVPWRAQSRVPLAYSHAWVYTSFSCEAVILEELYDVLDFYLLIEQPSSSRMYYMPCLAALRNHGDLVFVSRFQIVANDVP